MNIFSNSSKRMVLLGTVAVSIGIHSSAQANVTLVARDSLLKATYVAGYAGDIIRDDPANNSVSSTSTITDYPLSYSGAAHIDGYYAPANHSYDATVTWNTSQTFATEMDSAGITRVTSSGSTFVSSVQTGATSQIFATNQQVLTFELAQGTAFDLSAIATDNSAGSAMYMNFQVWTGVTWASMFLISDATPSFNASGNLDAGLYRMTGGVFDFSAFGNSSQEGTWSYDMQFAPVPEPSSMAALLLLVPGILKRRRKSVQ